MLERQIWEALQLRFDEEKDNTKGRILSGTCDLQEYARLCGYLKGIDFFEYALKEVRSPRKSQPEEED